MRKENPKIGQFLALEPKQGPYFSFNQLTDTVSTRTQFRMDGLGFVLFNGVGCVQEAIHVETLPKFHISLRFVGLKRFAIELDSLGRNERL